MEIKAQLNNLRIAPRKVRLLAGALKELDVGRAKAQLDHLTKRSAKPLAKLLDSALANAHNNLGLVKENLYIKQVIVSEGPKLKRFRPKGFGMTSPIEKKTSHVKIILDEKIPGLKVEKKVEIKKNEPEISEPKIKAAEKKPAYAKTQEIGAKKKSSWGRLRDVKRFFRRKAI